MEESVNNKKRVRDDLGEPDLDSPEVKRLRDDLLDILDDSDHDPATQDLDSVMKSLEEEISASSSSPPPVVDQTSDSGESQPELGYLLEASDDELGLPPSSVATSTSEVEQSQDETAAELERLASNSSAIGEFWGFDDQIPSYDSFGLGINDDYSGDYVAFGGLFEYSDSCFDSSDVQVFSWREETQPAE
ncbi:uncharacterized protein LOC110822903 [Carica papaya]|uniref:uncharacterized protein LOC110822903 n=1 Tax=Carica papaya TaxID=3649 RepID=UPI000B8C6F06|nr:uncharacterized protein LOC110822903 [Carica papaya]